MAFRFKNAIVLPSGYTAEVVRLVSYRVDHEAREASGTFKVFKDEAAEQAATHQVIRLRLRGADFDAAFGKMAKELAMLAGLSIEAEAILYRTVKAAPGLAYSDFDAKAGKVSPVLADAEELP